MSQLGLTRYNRCNPKFFIRRAVYPRLTGYSAPTTVMLRMSLSFKSCRRPQSCPLRVRSARASTPITAMTDSGRSDFTLHWRYSCSEDSGAEGGAASPRLFRAALTVRLFWEKILFIMAVCSALRVLLHLIVTRQEFTRGGGSNERLLTPETISTCAEAWEITDTAL